MIDINYISKSIFSSVFEGFKERKKREGQITRESGSYREEVGNGTDGQEEQLAGLVQTNFALCRHSNRRERPENATHSCELVIMRAT